MEKFSFCARCSKKIRLSEDIGLSVYVGVGNSGFLCEFVLVVPEESMTVVLFEWRYRVSWREKMFWWELESKELEVEDERIMDEIDRERVLLEG